RAGETYNIGGNCERTNLYLIRYLCEIMDERRPNAPWCPHQHLISFVKDRPGHDRRYAIDASKIRSELGYLPKHAIESGLQELVRWYLSNEHWWRSLLARREQ
ncbi:MAG: GDP-mannose 4,6-dehydratase, partial [Acidiferrobacteraceae bacterium]